MGEVTGIEWCSHTFNPWRGCTKVSDGCKFCYAETLSARNPATLGTWGPKGERVIAAESYWRQPLKWDREAREAGERRRVFCASLADVFEGQETVPQLCWEPVQEARQRLFTLARQTKWLDWLFLTKRPENIPSILSSLTHPEYPHTDWWTLQQRQPRPNWWFGTSVEDQEAADKRIPELLKIPAKVRFLSCEPLLGAVDLSLGRWIRLKHTVTSELAGVLPGHGNRRANAGIYRAQGNRHGALSVIDQSGELLGVKPDEFERLPDPTWIICGGESGPNARPLHPDWARSLRDQCQAAGVPFLFKQWGEWASGYDLPDEQKARIFSFPGHVFHNADSSKTCVYHVGKKAAGRRLDGQLYDEFPFASSAVPQKLPLLTQERAEGEVHPHPSTPTADLSPEVTQ